MLSVLIPIYNYNAYALVEEIHRQCLQAKIAFEICCYDDASTINIPENKQISNLSSCRIIYLSKNTGRSGIRNLLAKQAKYNWLMFLDADVFPDAPDFIQRYINTVINDEIEVVYGGLSYASKAPSDTKVLRWLYGKHREAINIKKRQKKCYKSILFSNILLHRKVFFKIEFNEWISNYGYEDLVFGLQLKKLKARVKHIHNPACHLHIENSEIFIEKTRKSLHNLKFLITNQIIEKRATTLSKVYDNFKKYKGERILYFLFLKLKKRCLKNLLSPNPSLFVFDLYKLGYFCMINQK